ncbi:MAG: deoxynucleoside kinase [Candidatus Paceibacterota bacterium]
MSVSVSGIIGAGKTTLVTGLAEELGWPIAKEPMDERGYLPLFYADPARWAFPFQVEMLTERFQCYRSALAQGSNTLIDRSVFEDPVFANTLADSNMISAVEITTYCKLFDLLRSQVQPIDLFVYLDVKPEVALERIATRDRKYEKGIDLQYLGDLKRGYESWLESLVGTRIMRLDWNTIKPDAAHTVAHRIRTTLGLQLDS